MNFYSRREVKFFLWGRNTPKNLSEKLDVNALAQIFFRLRREVIKNIQNNYRSTIHAEKE